MFVFYDCHIITCIDLIVVDISVDGGEGVVPEQCSTGILEGTAQKLYTARGRNCTGIETPEEAHSCR